MCWVDVRWNGSEIVRQKRTILRKKSNLPSVQPIAEKGDSKAEPLTLEDLKDQQSILKKQIEELERSLAVIENKIYWTENPSGSF